MSAFLEGKAVDDQFIKGRGPEAQAFRSERVIAAAAKLATEGGYEGVHMRDVANLAKVSLATLYRYYPSKEDLILVLFFGELESLRTDVLRRPPRQRSPHGRACAVLLRSFHALERNRGYAHAVTCGLATPEPFDAPQSRKMRESFVDVVALGAWGERYCPTTAEYMLLHMLQAIFNDSVIRWLNGAMDAPYVEHRFQVACERLIDAPSGHRKTRITEVASEPE
jgi:AcrR family transcriptional regulator